MQVVFAQNVCVIVWSREQIKLPAKYNVQRTDMKYTFDEMSDTE